LRSLTVFDGDALHDERVSPLIRENCPRFEALAFFNWMSPECDEELAQFFSGLQDQSLRSFTIFGRASFGPSSCLALNKHGNCLKFLELQLERDVLPKLNLLKECIALETLKMTDNARVDLEGTQHDVFLGIIAWFLECRKLRSLSLNAFSSGAALCTPVLLDQDIHLEQLEVVSYAAKDQNEFHKALAHQATLQRLILDSDIVDTRDGLDDLTNSLCQLKQLRTLRLIGVSAMLADHHISALSENLENLEDLYVGGLGLSDRSLEDIALLRNLRSMAFSGITTFTLEGLLDFISRLDTGNRGMVLAVDNADPDRGLSESEQAYVRQTLAEQVDGRLEYTFLRGGLHIVTLLNENILTCAIDPDISEFEGESD
jgi:hypothetical protein